MGIGPTRPAWKAGILPLNYTRIRRTSTPYQQRLYIIALLKRIVKQFFALFEKISENFLFFFQVGQKPFFFLENRRFTESAVRKLLDYNFI